eukprot:jgi/Mesvir1/15998/Mv08302-RA.2
MPTVLMVAEKPSIALSIAQALSYGKMSTQRSALDVHYFNGSFRGRHADFKCTSVIGHIYNCDFPPNYQNWDTTDPASLFDAPTVKVESNKKAHVCKHLQSEAKGCEYLVLWLDCDREGENICFEVMENTVQWMRTPEAGAQQVYRAKFSAISAPAIQAAMTNLGEPSKNESLSVDARQELDLKVGVAFTRFQTRYFQGKYGNLDASVISYGPCQTPTLGFCVERHQRIVTFVPEPFWVVRPLVVKGGRNVELEWERGRIFDKDIAMVFQKLVAEAGSLHVVEWSEKEERKQRPHGLNTVEMLKAASSGLNMGPAYALQIAERLYTQGYISYPRTESSAYPPGFDLHGTLAAQSRHPVWGEYAASLVAKGFAVPKGGTDVGDHPPITPVCAATESELGGGDMWRLYDHITRHFLGTLSPDCRYIKMKAVFAAGDETFSASGKAVVSPGFTAVMPWQAMKDEPLPVFARGELVPMKDVELHQGKTAPPEYLTESELLTLMEKFGIGTDASMSTHINNICERNYVKVNASRQMVPTPLGIALVRGYQLIDPDLCLPDVRRYVEQQIDLIAQGKAHFAHVVASALREFFAKFQYFVLNIGRMDSLFEATFSPLASSGKPLSKCGKCQRYMKYIPMRPARLFCPTCDEVYPLPQNGQIKLYKEIACPLDGFQLVLFSLSGPDGKTYPLCPFCYSNPPFEGVGKLFGGDASKGAGGMPCSMCPHPTCKNSMAAQGVCACPECEGTMVLDPVSAPRWRLDCNRCNCLVYIAGEGAHRVTVFLQTAPCGFRSHCACHLRHLQLVLTRRWTAMLP